jgi:hypothetical protein
MNRDDLVGQLIFIEKVEEGLRQSEEGKVISNEDVKLMIDSWSKSGGKELNKSDSVFTRYHIRHPQIFRLYPDLLHAKIATLWIISRFFTSLTKH